jgi:signal transduction histidine kinase
VSPERHGRQIRRRLARANVFLILGTAAICLAVVYWAMGVLLDRRSDESLGHELDVLVSHHSSQGARSLTHEIERRIGGPELGPYVYVYTESRHERIVGNLSGWPEGLGPEVRDRRMSLQVTYGQRQSLRRVDVASKALPDGRHLLVGRDVTEDEELLRSVAIAMGGAFVIAAVIAIAGGLSISRRLLGRVEGMNETVLGILEGHTGERVPHDDSGDEFDELSHHFNDLLDENDRLVRRMREVTDDVAHDLRTPLAHMRNRIESALAVGVADPRASDTLHELMEDADRIIETFNALIHIARIESHGIREAMSELALDSLVQDTVDLYRPVVEESGISIKDEVGQDVRVRGDRHLISQALSNLIDNAIKYSGHAGDIEVTARWRDGRAELLVRDHGEGIPEAERERVLERFVRLDASRNQPGSGLGLSFVAAVAQHHGAELSLADAQPGLSVEFRFPNVGPTG